MKSVLSKVAFMYIVLSAGYVYGQKNKVNISRKVDADEFMNDSDVRSLMKQNHNFVYEIEFSKQYENEALLFMKSTGKSGSLFIVRWDALDVSIYHENFRGDVVHGNRKIVVLDSSANEYKLFVDKQELLSLLFFVQKSDEKMKYYETEFIFLRRRNDSLVWGICAFNGREFRNENEYPDYNCKSLVDYILLEFGGIE